MKRFSFLSLLLGYSKGHEEFYSVPVPSVGEQTHRALSALGISRLLSFLNRAFLNTPTRTYGAGLLSFGLGTLLFYFIKDFLYAEESFFYQLVTGAVVSTLSILLLFNEKPLFRHLKESPLWRGLLYDFFRLKRADPAPTPGAISPWLFMFFGLCLSVGGFFTTPLWMLAIMGLLLIAVLCFVSPEMPFLLTVILLPYLPMLPHPTAVAAGLCLVTLLSYARKVLLGKRSMRVEQYDLILLFFALLYLVAGLHSGTASSLSALPLVLFSLCYIPAANLMADSGMQKNTAVALALFSVPPAVLAIYEYISGAAAFGWLDRRFVGVIDGRVTATFENPNLYAAYLCPMVCLCLYLTLFARRKRSGLLFFVCLAFNLCAVVLTWSRGAWLALGIAALVIFFLRLKRGGGLVWMALIALPYLLFLLPQSVLTRLFSILDMTDSSTAYRLSIYRSSLDMWLDNLWTGIGVGMENFSLSFRQYAEDAVVAPHAHNLLLQIACEAGSFALLFFLLLLLCRAVHLSAYSFYVRNAEAGPFVKGTSVAVFSMLAFGITDYSFAAPINYLLFVILFAAGSAALRLCREEDQKMREYFADERSASTAALDIRIP